MRVRALILAWLALAAPALWAGGVPATVDVALVPGYRVLEHNLATAGQPSAEGLARLGKLGFTTIVNLRTAAEGAAAERSIVEAQGLRYVSIPIGSSIPREAAEQLDALVRDPGAGAILVHCASGNRAGALWAAVQVVRGRPLDEAEREGLRAGIHSRAMMEAVQSLARDRGSK